ncbi:hypothetical protein EPICR_20144 [Candidatus Desulfarcum epimagneticum]|uniref:Uncharacterized protein n=1 Tax=uncultured Desulfobacteraceae bacterium TaxID=218296 RepID=A0A484HEH0_9BACT|nr:hypothetical protein EPICR_20144 [uncultured Desulfobacteraceae bacterium]
MLRGFRAVRFVTVLKAAGLKILRAAAVLKARKNKDRPGDGAASGLFPFVLSGWSLKDPGSGLLMLSRPSGARKDPVRIHFMIYFSWQSLRNILRWQNRATRLRI